MRSDRTCLLHRVPSACRQEVMDMGVIGPKIRVDHRVESYEGINALSAIVMAFSESVGLRSLIDAECSYDRERRILSPGMGIKCMMGPIMWLGCKLPLVRVERNYIGVPCDLIFGEGIESGNLNDDALGRCLDTVAETDMRQLVNKSSELCRRRFGFESQVYHDDGTNIPFYGMSKDDVEEEGFKPAFACSPKDHRRDLLHYCLQMTVDENGILVASKGHRGDITDIEADRDTIAFLGEILEKSERERIVYVADSKMATKETLGKLRGLGIRFVTRCPTEFGFHLQERALDAAMAASCSRSDRYPDLEIYDEMLIIGKPGRTADTHPIRTLVCFSDTRFRKKLYEMESERLKTEQRIRDRVDGRHWGSTQEISDFLSSFALPTNCRIVETIGSFTIPGKADYRGRRRKDEVVPDIERYRIERIEVVADTAAAEIDARRASATVLITDIPCTESDQAVYRTGMTADGIVQLYREEHKVEHCIRFTKSGCRIDQVFLQTPSRENAMMFMVSELAVLTTTADAVFRREGMTLNGSRMTMNALMHELVGSTIRLDRGEMRMFIEHPLGKEIDLFAITDALKINPRLLLGYMDC